MLRRVVRRRDPGFQPHDRSRSERLGTALTKLRL